MNVTFYNFSKRVNSTARPSGGVSVNCFLKSPCSTTHPTLDLQFTEGTEPSGWNMCYIPQFGRYYYISEWVYDETVWTAHCDVDSLATWKTEIGESSCYILRCSADSDGALRDDKYPVRSLSTAESDVEFTTDIIGDGFYVIGLTPLTGIGAVTYYAMTESQFSDMSAHLFDTVLTNLGLYDPLQYVHSLKWFPMDMPAYTPSTFKLGLLTHEHNAYRITPTSSLVTYSATAAISQHPYSSLRGTYLNREPYTIHKFSWVPFGDFDLPLSGIYSSEDESHNGLITIQLIVDFISGSAALKIQPFANGIHDVVSTVSQFGIDIPIGSTTMDLREVAEIAVKTGSFIAGNIADSAIEYNKELVLSQTLKRADTRANHLAKAKEIRADSIIANSKTVGSGIVSGFNAVGLMSHSKGSAGSRLMMSNILPPKVYSKYLLPVEDNNSEFGRPLCKTKTISTIPGFIQCGNSDVEIAGTLEEATSIKSFLDTGFFYE